MKVKIMTYGCSLNQSDGEIISGIVREKGYEIVDEDEDILIVNTCTVKTPTERKIRKLLDQQKETEKIVVVTGCMPAAQPEMVDDYPGFSFIGVNSSDIKEVLEKQTEGKRCVKIQETRGKLNRVRVKKNNLIGIVPISEGCLGSCTYCITKKARGKLRSYTTHEIVTEIKGFLKDGCKEIWLTSQDTGCWGFDLDKKLPELLDNVCKIPGDFRVRIGMMNIRHVHSYLNELINSYENEKMYKFTHIPIQSGSNRVLSDMKRGYDVENFMEVAEKLRNEADVNISTDIIVGYPTETEQEFQKTVDLIKKLKPDVLNVSRYWERPGTESSKTKGHPTRITKERSRIIDKLFKETGLKQNKKWIGWTGRCLVCEKGKNNSYTCRNGQYKPIIVKSKKNILGEWIDVEVESATYFDLRGEIKTL